MGGNSLYTYTETNTYNPILIGIPITNQDVFMMVKPGLTGLEYSNLYYEAEENSRIIRVRKFTNSQVLGIVNDNGLGLRPVSCEPVANSDFAVIAFED